MVDAGAKHSFSVLVELMVFELKQVKFIRFNDRYMKVFRGIKTKNSTNDKDNEKKKAKKEENEAIARPNAFLE